MFLFPSPTGDLYFSITSANICSTKKEAEKVIDFWNKCYKKNKTYGGF